MLFIILLNLHTIAYKAQMAFLLQMIHKTIFYLLSDQKEEADHMYWCDMEKEMSIESKDDKDEKIQVFKAKIVEHGPAQPSKKSLGR